jgi:hypothetical protein
LLSFAFEPLLALVVAKVELVAKVGLRPTGTKETKMRVNARVAD